MTVAIASTNTLERPSWSPSGMAGREVQLSESLRLAAVTERSQDITLHTREGDVVTLSMDRETVAVYGRDARLSHQVQYAGDDGGRQTARNDVTAESREWFGLESSRSFTLSIEGDLSREEMRDIRKALHRIHRLIGQSLGVDTKAPPQRAGLAGLDSLAGIEVTIQQSRTLMAARSTSISAASYGVDGQISPSPDRPTATERPAWQTTAEQAAGIVGETGIDPMHFKQPLEDLFGRWSHVLRRRQDTRHLGMLTKIAGSLGDRLGLSAGEGGPREWWTPWQTGEHGGPR